MKSTVLLCDFCNGTQTFATERVLLRSLHAATRRDFCAEHFDLMLGKMFENNEHPRGNRQRRSTEIRIRIRAYLSKHGATHKNVLYRQIGKEYKLNPAAFGFHISQMKSKKLIKRLGRALYST